MAARSRIGGRHFAALEAIEKNEPVKSEPALRDLRAWGYVAAGDVLEITNEGKQALRTWRDMDPAGQT